jgi:hypothetical protein
VPIYPDEPEVPQRRWWQRSVVGGVCHKRHAALEGGVSSSKALVAGAGIYRCRTRFSILCAAPIIARVDTFPFMHLGRIDIQRSQIMAAARWMKPVK